MEKAFALVAICSLIFAGCGKGGGASVSNQKNFDALPDAVETPATDTMNWTNWRGPNRNGVAVNQNPPVNWSKDQNVLWKTKVPGRGHSSPIIIGDQIFLTSSSTEEKTQSLICFDRLTGNELWNKVVHTDGLTKQIHMSNSYASATVASDGNSVFCKFVNQGQVFVSRYGLDGEQKWQKAIGKFRSDFGFGSGASPIFWNGKLIVSSESGTDPFIQALNPENGDLIWRIDRAKNTSYSTPVVAVVAGKYQLLISGSETVQCYDPESGNPLWSCPSSWKVSCGTMVWDKDIVFASGGFPVAQTIAVRADGSGEKVWEHQVKCYEQSLISTGGYVYGLTDSGICYCWEAESGKQMWKKRMKSKVSASPVLAGGRIYFTNETGSCFVINANPNAYELVAENQLGESVYATPTFVDDKIYTRVGFGTYSAREEWLYCIGK